MTLPSPQDIAAQLRCPEGPVGVEFGRTMNLRNLSMVVGALGQLSLGDSPGTPPGALLEVGCGDGGLLGYVLSLAPGMRYTGLEISRTMVEQALSFNAAFVAAGLAEYRLYDGGRFPMPDGVFSHALSVNTVYFWDEPEELLGEICRVLQPGGTLCLTFAEKEFMRTLPFAEHGFHERDADDVLGWIRGARLPLRQQARADQRDLAVSKDGALVNRPYVHLVLRKD